MSKYRPAPHVTEGYFRGPEEAKETTVSEAIKARRKVTAVLPEVPPAPAPKTDLASLEHEIYLAQLGVRQYESMLTKGDYIPPDEMRIFLSLLNTLRQLKVSLEGIKARQKEEHMGPVEVALGLVATGMDKEEVLKLYPDNKDVKKALDQ